MNNFERKFGRYAVSNLSLKLVVLYIIGYVLYFVQPAVFALLTLDVTAVLNGQIWRVLSWLLVPPDAGSNLFFVAIMLYFYYNIGTSLERVWGDFKYNVYIFLGIFLTVLSAFAWTVFMRVSGVSGLELATMTKYAAPYFSTYYINMSIFLAFALTFPEAQVFLFFVLPIKVKYLGWVDLGFLVLSMAGPPQTSIPQIRCRGKEKRPRSPVLCHAPLRDLRKDGKRRGSAGIPLLHQVRGRT